MSQAGAGDRVGYDDDRQVMVGGGVVVS